MASIANGGSADDIAPGVDFFKQAQDGRQLPAGRPDPGDDRVRADPRRHRLGLPATPPRPTSSAKGIDWKIVVPDNAVVGGYYYQAINKDAPHPAAARLWEEFLYSRPRARTCGSRGGARPVRADAMKKAGTLDKAAFAALPRSPARRSFLRRPGAERQGRA